MATIISYLLFVLICLCSVCYARVTICTGWAITSGNYTSCDGIQCAQKPVNISTTPESIPEAPAWGSVAHYPDYITFQYMNTSGTITILQNCTANDPALCQNGTGGFGQWVTYLLDFFYTEIPPPGECKIIYINNYCRFDPGRFDCTSGFVCGPNKDGKCPSASSSIIVESINLD